MKKKTKILLILLVVLVALIFSIVPIAHFAGEVMWWQSTGYFSVYVKKIFLQIVSFVLPFLLSYAILNMWFYGMHKSISSIALNLMIWSVSIAAGVWGVLHWKLFIWNVGTHAIGFADPIFGLDAYFYMFRLPLIQMVLIMVNFFFLLLLVLDLIVHRRKSGPILRDGRIKFWGSSILLLALNIFGVIANMFTNMFEQLVAQPNAKIGVGYAVVRGQFYGNYIFIGVLLLIFLLFILQSRRGVKIKVFLLYVVILAAAFPLLTIVYPKMVDNYYVKPNELMKQKEFIQHRIDFTRKGFNIKFTNYVFNHNIKKDLPAIFNNMRVWDTDPYKQVVHQVQEIKAYFDFRDVDVDKYIVEGEARQVVISARELNINNLPFDAVTWDNIHLRYTHGYGVAMSPANMVNKDGGPVFWVKNLDNTALYPIFDLKYPQIYYGELTSNYIIVKTTADELEYSTDKKRITTKYKADKGIKIGNFFNKFVYSILFSEKLIMLTEYITTNSRLMYRRNIHERVKYIFPFFDYDKDPYITIIDGKLYWIMDAYTTSDRFPIAQRFSSEFGKINYLRNPVKVVIDAYTGDIDFYIVDDTDPIVNSYRFIFPELFKTNPPVELEKHFRYPNTVFKIQARILCTYHVESLESFYNGDDVWKIPEQIYGDKKTNFEPYYMLARVGDKYQFSLINPFNPIGKENLSSWLIAYYDKGPKLTLRYVDKISSSLGPLQIESRIDQDDAMSRLFSLWGQKGSRVFRGNIQFIPIQNNALYLEPIFLESEDTSIPQLVRILTVMDGMVFQGKNFAELLNQIRDKVFGSGDKNARRYITDTYRFYLEAEKSRIDGDMKSYQENVDNMGRALKSALELME